MSRILIVMFSLLFLLPQKKQVKVYLIGDSTMADKEIKAYPETGWGMPFHYFFDSSIIVDNRAKNGRSTRTFLSEHLWQSVEEGLKEGDYVFIQFGHNDEVKEKTDRYTSPEDYRANLIKFINETRAKKAIPILLTPVGRRKFDASGTVMETHEEYSKIVRDIAAQNKVLFIDLDEKSKALYQQFGADNSKWLFMQLDPGEHPNYPEGRNDNTHFNELGARKIAEIVLNEIEKMPIDLAKHVRPPLVTKK